jgi:hypothetical protein
MDVATGIAIDLDSAHKLRLRKLQNRTMMMDVIDCEPVTYVIWDTWARITMMPDIGNVKVLFNKQFGLLWHCAILSIRLFFSV